MIEFDISRRPTRPAEWTALVNALLESDDNDESYWLEFKSTLDWSKATDLGNLSRAIIGMANRDVVAAREYVEGRGIIVVGLEPKNLVGVRPLDPAELDSKLQRYLGKDGPRWDARWPKIGEVSVLVIEVEPPKNGDPLYVLNESFGNFRAGQVLVRELGRTTPADQSQLSRLARRMVAKEIQSLDLDVAVQTPTPIRPYFWEPAQVEKFIELERRGLMQSLADGLAAEMERAAAADRDASRPFSSIKAAESITTALALGTLRRESRTAEDFTDEVEAYIERVRDELPEVLLEIAKAYNSPPIFIASNLGHRNFRDVQITLHVGGDVEAYDHEEEAKKTIRDLLPRRPRKYGPWRQRINIGGTPPGFDIDSLTPFHAPIYSRRSIENGGSFTLKLGEIDIRPGEQGIVVEDETVILVPRSRTEPMIVTWTATASNLDAVAEGAFVLPADGDPIDSLNGGV